MAAIFMSAVPYGRRKVWSSEIGLLSKKTRERLSKTASFTGINAFRSRPRSVGNLIGVRPTKHPVHHLLTRALTKRLPKRWLTDDYDVAEKTARDLVAMAQLQRPYVTDRGRKLALRRHPVLPQSLPVLLFPSRLIGGEGEDQLTPFAMPCCETSTIWRLLPGPRSRRDQSLRRRRDADLSAAAGVAAPHGALWPRIFPTPANGPSKRAVPDTAEEGVLTMLKGCGVNRISVNPQTMQQHLLDALGRRHRVRIFIPCMRPAARRIFRHQHDFIAGLPAKPWPICRKIWNSLQTAPGKCYNSYVSIKNGHLLFHHDPGNRFRRPR